MAKQVLTDNLTGEVSTPEPEPGPTADGFTLGQGEVGQTKLEDGEHGVVGFLLVIGVLLFFLGSVVYGKKKADKAGPP